MATSPMISQYKQIKRTYPDTILMFRLGDFYEMFFEDAVTVSTELDLTLTGRACGDGQRAPMCGVPHHAVQTYIAKLLKKGFKVAICEQMQDPKEVKGKDIVAREVTRIITGGTITDPETLSNDKNNFLMSLFLNDKGVGAVWTDITTSETYNYFIPCPVKVKLNDLLMRIKPAEIICNSLMLKESVELSAVKYGAVCALTQYDDDKFDLDVAKAALSASLGEKEMRELISTPNCLCAEGALVAYVRSLQFRNDVNIGAAENFVAEAYMDIDANSARTLELVESQSHKRGTTLRDVINKTSTPMGDRQLQKWLLRPLCNKAKIDARLDAVGILYSDTILRERVKAALSQIKDILRVSANLALGEIKSKDVVALGLSLAVLPDILSALKDADSALLADICSRIDDCPQACELIDRAIYKGIYGEGKDKSAQKASKKDKEQSILISNGYDVALDEYRALVRNSRNYIAQMEADEREKTGIKNLRITYNRLFGYFIEVPRQFDPLVPQNYVRRQTVANAERYITDELKQLEYKVLNAAELSEKREQELYLQVLAQLRTYCAAFTRTGKAIADLDCLVSLACAAKANGYCRPTITENGEITVTEGRHPVAELLPSDELFVPNNTALNVSDSKIMLITGPNMAGKSLYMRQVALICILAHIGSFVPAKSASIGLIDKVFTRVGASDDISTGRSTFMVEMSEVSQIMDNATDASLILLDEIGRGTSTYDGLSIAWAVIE